MPEVAPQHTVHEIREAFSREWSVRLSALLGPLSVVLALWCLYEATDRITTLAAVTVYVAVNVLLSFPESRGFKLAHSYHLRVLGNVLSMSLLVWAAGPAPLAWVFGIPTMIGGAFAAERWQARYIQFTTLVTLAAGSWLAGVPDEWVVSTSLVLMLVAISVENIYVALRESMVSGQLRERAFAKVNAELEAALAARKSFLATMSHEIRTPMNGVLGMAELLDTTSLSPEQREMVDVIRSSGGGLLRVINDVLDLSKLESGRVEADRVAYRPRAVITDVVSLMRHGDLASDVALTVHFTELPDRLVGDPSRLRQVLLNLVGNAVKFTTEGTIDVHATWRDDRLTVSVSDTGPGISPDRIEQLFAPFVQGDASHNRPHGGTGLGLAICRRLVELMGGILTASSVPGVGSTFTFHVRAPVARRAPAEAPLSPVQLVSGTRSLHAKVLLVDDNPVNLTVADAMLQRLGCTVTALDNAAAALEVIDEEAFDIVLMDCQMPDMDGFEATRTLRSRGHVLPILALTAGVTQEERQRCTESGMDAILAKPATMRGLREALARWTTTETPEDGPPVDRSTDASKLVG